MTHKTYVISDTHFGHANIIKYCSRPFSNVSDMNRIMMNNWNNIVNPDDIVYFLGDLCMKYPKYYLKNLNGNKTLIRGNHDKWMKYSTNYKVINYNNEDILLIHSPDYIDFKWDGWVIHGHHHNNDMIKHPFINNHTKMINVSVEMIDYKPIELNDVLNKRHTTSII